MNKQTINKIKELSKKLSQKEIARKLNISIHRVRYYLDENYRQYRINKAKSYYKKLPKEKKQELNTLQRENKEYFRIYFNKRYQTDQQFRENHKKRVLTYYLKKYKTDQAFREKRLKISKEQYSKKNENKKRISQGI